MLYNSEYKSTVTIKDKETKAVEYKMRHTLRNANTVSYDEAKARFRKAGHRIAQEELGYAEGEYLLSVSAPKQELWG